MRIRLRDSGARSHLSGFRNQEPGIRNEGLGDRIPSVPVVLNDKAGENSGSGCRSGSGTAGPGLICPWITGVRNQGIQESGDRFPTSYLLQANL